MENSSLCLKMNLGAGYALIINVIWFAGRSGAQDDPCKDKQSNADIRDCYRNQQLLVNRAVVCLASRFNSRLEITEDLLELSLEFVLTDCRNRVSPTRRYEQCFLG